VKNLKRAVEIFPEYADAWNVLGVIAMRQSDPGKAEKYFRKAIDADNSATLALINLGRLYLQKRQYDEGGNLIGRAVQLDPRNPEALTLLAYLALLRDHLEDAIEVSHRVHTLEHKQYALVHFVAANAYERKQLHQEAADEYKQYLQESPDGPSAAQARAALSSLRASIR
jgi:Tfp pilus assembly protein PilF